MKNKMILEYHLVSLVVGFKLKNKLTEGKYISSDVVTGISHIIFLIILFAVNALLDNPKITHSCSLSVSRKNSKI